MAGCAWALSLEEDVSHVNFREDGDSTTHALLQAG
jgi:hypothetical protein